MPLVPTMYLRFVKRRVGINTVRILQQKWEDTEVLHEPEGLWRDVPMEDPWPRATMGEFSPTPD